MAGGHGPDRYICVCVCACVYIHTHTHIYIYIYTHTRARGRESYRRVEVEGVEEGGLVNGILLGHPFTRTLRKLEDLIWRAVWMPFAPAMPPIEPLLIYVRIYTRSQIRAQAYTHARLLHTSHARSVTLTPSLPRVFARVSVARSTCVCTYEYL